MSFTALAQHAQALERAGQSAEAAGVLASLGSAQRKAGQTEEAIASFRRALRLRPNAPELHYNLGNAQLASGRAEEAARAFRRALDLRPSFADAANNLGNALLAAGRPEEALRSFEAFAALAPDHPEAHANMAQAQARLGRHGDAMARLRQALAMQPERVDFWALLLETAEACRDETQVLSCRRRLVALMPQDADMHRALGEALIGVETDEAALCLERSLALRPGDLRASLIMAGLRVMQDRLDDADAALDAARVGGPGDEAAILTSRANVLRMRMRLDEAEAAQRSAIALAPDYAPALTGQAVQDLLHHRVRAGFALCEHRFRAGMQARDLPSPRWQGETMAGTLLLYAEQGLGDILQICRYVPAASSRVGRVVLMVQPPLVRLMALSFPQAEVMDDTAPAPAHDAHLPMMSLFFALGLDEADVPGPMPYLRAAPDRVAAWRERLAALPGRKVGLRWAGNPISAFDKTRSVPWGVLVRVLDVPGITFVNLQKDEPAPAGLVDWTEELGSFAETAALIEALDLVVSADTSVAHAAGGLNRPLWLMNRFNTDWRWLVGRSDSPWYPGCRIFRQATPGDWAGVVADIDMGLRGLGEGLPS